MNLKILFKERWITAFVKIDVKVACLIEKNMMVIKNNNKSN